MSDKVFSRLIKTVAALVLLLTGAGVWYYTLGRKPKLALSVPITDKTGVASLHAVGFADVNADGGPDLVGGAPAAGWVYVSDGAAW